MSWGGKFHHDGSAVGRESAELLDHNPMLTLGTQSKTPTPLGRIQVTTHSRPEVGSQNLSITVDDHIEDTELPKVGDVVSPRAGSELAYRLIAEQHGPNMHVVSCDLDPSTKLAKAAALVDPGNHHEMGILEAGAAQMLAGLGMNNMDPRFNVMSTFSAFWENIASELFDMLGYTSDLDGNFNGLNLTIHESHVGSQVGRDGLPGMNLRWLTQALSYSHHMRRIYTPADARAAFRAVIDAASHYGTHVIAIPRDKLPIIDDGSGNPFWTADRPFREMQPYYHSKMNKKAIVVAGAPTSVAVAAWREIGDSVNLYFVNALPLSTSALNELVTNNPEGIVTVEDGLIGDFQTGLLGLAGVINTAASRLKVPVNPIGIHSSMVRLSYGAGETWNHFGITKNNIVEAMKSFDV